jgi:beta-lactamase class C
MTVARALAIMLVMFLGVTAANAATPLRRTMKPRAHAPRVVEHKAQAKAADVPSDAKAVAADFDAWLDEVEQSNQVSGLAAAIVSDKTVLLQRGIGFADASKGKPITPDSVFRLASLSKAFASALTAMLVDEGMLSWQTKVSGVLPTFELHDITASNSLTVRDILSQRVGLPHNTYDNLLEQNEPYQELVEKLREVPLSCAVGDCYGYQNITFALIGDITYAVSGDFFYHQVEKRIFHPLGMDSATYGRDALEASPNWAQPHARHRSGWVPIGIKESYYHVPPAAGVNASIKDMTQWLIAQMGGRPDVLSKDLLTTLHTPLVSTPTELHATPWRRARLSDASYALGWRIYEYGGQTLVFHAGAVQGYRSMIAFFPKQKFGAVMLWNCECVVPGGLMPMLLDRYLGLPRVDWAGLDSLPVSRVATGGNPQTRRRQ